MKVTTLIILVILAVVVISCAKQVVEETVVDTPKEPVVEQPTVVEEITVEPEQGNGMEPIVIEIVAAREVMPFNPTVKVGQEIIFVNKHVEGKEDRTYYIRGDRFANFESPTLEPGDEWSYTFDEAGDYQYSIMPGAAARISVVGNFVRKLFG